MAINFQLGYYPWITQHVEPAKIRSSVELFASTFAKELQQELSGATVVVTNPVDVAQQVERIISYRRVIELMNPLGFVFGRLKSRKLEAVAVAQRIIDGKVGVNYFAQLYTHVASGVTSIDQAVQKSVGYGVPFSTSNFLIPALELQKQRIHPFLDFRTVKFLGGHDKVATAVYQQKVVLGAGHDGSSSTSAVRRVSRTPSQSSKGLCGRRLFPVIRSSSIFRMTPSARPSRQLWSGRAVPLTESRPWRIFGARHRA
jgi:ABC-type phosphate/phosphonate transport system substrate-binding protein